MDDEKDNITVGDSINYIVRKNSNTCFEGTLGYSDADLGMDKILSLIQSDEELLNLEIVYPENKGDKSTSSVCLMNPETKDVYVVFVGNYIDSPYTYIDKEGKITDIDSWVNNCQGALLRDTDEQKRDLDFYIDAIEAVRKEIGDDKSDLNITVCGHSTGGNHAQYVTIAYGEYDHYCDINDIDKCVSFDGQGFSQAFLNHYRPLIKSRADKITSYCPTVSIVGSLLKTIEGINQKHIDIGSPDAIGIGLHMPAELINDEGEFKTEGYPGMVYQLLNAYSKSIFKIADVMPGININNASEGFGEFLSSITDHNKEDVTGAIKDLATNKDAMAVMGVLISEIVLTSYVSIVMPDIPVGLKTFNEIQNTTCEMNDLISKGDYDLAIEKGGESISRLVMGYYFFTMGMSTGNPVLGLTGFIVGYYGGEIVYDFGNCIGGKINNAFDGIGDYLYDKLCGIKKLVHYSADPLVLDLDGDGFELLSVKDGVYFDEDKDACFIC